jgi:hypothetical protein
MDPVTRMRKVFLLSVFCLPIWAQTGTGSIQGTVRDATSAVIPNAAVKAVHVDTAREYQTSANQTGFYLFPAVQMGKYSLRITAAGMETWQGELLLQVGQRAVVDASLKVGAAATEITVAGDVTPLVTTTSATLGNIVERARIEQLPLNGRFLTNLVMKTTPGIEGSETAAKVYGLRSSSMEVMQDGATLENRDTGEVSKRQPGVDTVEEFRVETNNSSAKMTRPASAMIITKSGANQVHGAAFETARNSGLGVARRRQDYYDKPPHLVRNEFGASFGGPVYIPKVYNGKNRTFFFFGYEAYRNLAASTTSVTMPTMAMRQGDFSGLIDSAGRKTTIYDPWTTDAKWNRQPYINNTIPLARLSPLAKYLYNVTPAPTLLDVNPMVSANYFGPALSNRLDHTETFRIDQRLGQRDQVFARYTHGRSFATAAGGENGSPMLLDGSGNIVYTPVRDDTGVFSWTHTFSPTFFSETIASGSGEDWAVFSALEPIDYATRLGLPNPLKKIDLPYMNNMGFGMTYITQNRRNSITQAFNLDQNFTKVKGRHEIQFGGRFRNEALDALPDQQFAQGSHSFASRATGLYDPGSGSAYTEVARTGHAAANFHLGIAGVYSAQFNRGWYLMRAREYAGYVQDNFKVNSRLTLNLGIRWQFYPAVSETNGMLVGFDRKQRALVLGTSLDKMYQLGSTTPGIVKSYTDIGVKFISAAQAGLPDTLVYSHATDFWPRLGFAYRLTSGKQMMVLRGGYSTYGFPIPLRTYNARMRRDPPNFAAYSVTSTSPADSPDGLPNYALRAVPTVIAGVNSANLFDPNVPAITTRGSMRIDVFNPEQPTSRARQWNLMLERQIMDRTVVRAGYVGTAGRNIEQYYVYNQAPNSYIWFVTTGQRLPSGEYSGVARRGWDQVTYGEINEYTKSGFSNYSGIQLEVQRQYSRGIAFQFFYTMSNAFRAGGNSYNDDFVDETNMYMPGAVPADYDARNRFLNYRRDTDIPKHRLRWNWIVDLPFGRGKKLFGNAGGILNRFVGGWQLAGYGSMATNYWSLPTGNWGPMSNPEIYGKKYPIEDCRSGRCYQGFLFYNGYIPANRINSVDAQGRPNGVMGVPANYRPSSQPIIVTPANGGSSSDPNYAYYDTNTVWVTLKDNSVQRVSLDTALHPWRNQFVPGIRSWGLDASLFKSVPITERVNLRLNGDFFSVLNMPGLGQPNSSTGIILTQNSANNPRVLQLTLRLQW